MATIQVMPSQEVIDAYKGTLDFYVWKGIKCVRAWPQYPPRQPSPSEAANQTAFATIMKASVDLQPALIAQMKTSVAGTTWRWQDVWVRSYLKGILES
jgi:hypothetical protein